MLYMSYSICAVSHVRPSNNCLCCPDTAGTICLFQQNKWINQTMDAHTTTGTAQQLSTTPSDCYIQMYVTVSTKFPCIETRHLINRPDTHMSSCLKKHEWQTTRSLSTNPYTHNHSFWSKFPCVLNAYLAGCARGICATSSNKTTWRLQRLARAHISVFFWALAAKIRHAYSESRRFALQTDRHTTHFTAGNPHTPSTGERYTSSRKEVSEYQLKTGCGYLIIDWPWGLPVF